jgi:hypothetical protein
MPAQEKRYLGPDCRHYFPLFPSSSWKFSSLAIPNYLYLLEIKQRLVCAYQNVRMN